jgi:hypothetical protein
MIPIRNSDSMKRDGFIVMSLPPALTAAMAGHIGAHISGATGVAADGIDALTHAVGTLTDDQFVATFAKPRRMFPHDIGSGVNQWVESLAGHLGGARTGINYISKAEQEANPSLTPTSFDVFWRCVRSGKPDVGRAHADYQFWEINRGTPLDPPSAFDYDERWKIWLPLMGCDGTNSLEVIPGSHAEDVTFETVQTKYGTKPSISDAWVSANENRFICPLSRFENCCVLFHDKLVHRGPGNASGHLRISAELTILLKL